MADIIKSWQKSPMSKKLSKYIRYAVSLLPKSKPEPKSFFHLFAGQLWFGYFTLSVQRVIKNLNEILMKFKNLLFTDGGYDDGDKKKDDNGNKRRGPRTTIKAKQLEVLKHFFSII